VIDLSNVAKIDGAALSGILALIHRCRERQGMVFLAGPSPLVASRLQAVGAHHDAVLVRSVDDAVEWATGSAGSITG
jgi:anti-anti-sigma regulatory factor